MTFIYYAAAAVFIFLWMSISTIASLLFIPIILLITALFGYSKPTPESNSTSNVIPDHHIHVPLEKVPPEYYEAYSAYLKSKEWRVFRKTVLKRDRYRCVDCNVYGYNVDTNPLGPLLQVHHIHYDGIETMAFTTDQCVSVCPSCHDKRHGRI